MPRIRCSVEGCKKKISVVDEVLATCRCNKVFCSKHRSPEMHQCTHDYRFNKEQFIKENLCVADKITSV